MGGGLLGVRREEAGAVWLAFATLLAIVASHAVLETARDSLFLADLPASTLPWAYLGIAVTVFLVARWNARLYAGRSPARILAVMLLIGGVGTGIFWRIIATPTPLALVALYIWTGLVASMVVAQFWVQLGSRMDVGTAKRAYTIIAAGGMLGATGGSLVAGGVLAFAGPRTLLAVAAGMFVLAASLPAFAQPRDVTLPGSTLASPPDGTRPHLGAVWKDPYLKRILVLAILGPVIAMGVDFIFKSIVSHEVQRAALGHFFARYNAIVNGAALLFQLTLAPRLLQSISVVRNLCLLPSALGLVAAGVAGTAGLPAAVVLRGTDGVLRHSLHRAATEILFLPLSAATRSALRGLAESLGQRGGQVVGSAMILMAMGLGATPRHLAAGVAVLCGGWLLGYLRLQEQYVERFRGQLRASSVTSDAAVPALDLASLETLVAALSAPNDAEVLAALDLLESYGRVHLVSPLILYHPSSPVALRALELFAGVSRDDVQETRRRLLEHHDSAVRAASLRALVAGGYDRAIVRTLLRRDPSPRVRITALILWMGFDDTPRSDLNEAVADLMALSDPDARLAVASTLGELPAEVLLPVARTLLDDATPAIRRQVARALATDPDESRLALLMELVAIPECRAFARAGLLALGEPALEHLARALESTETPEVVRRHLPRTISRFGTSRAAEILVARLPHEESGRVIFKILRGLGRMRASDPTLPVDRPILVALAESTLHRMIELLAYQVAYEHIRSAQPDAPPHRGSDAGEQSHVSLPDETDLLGRLLVEKKQRALERVFRVLQILDPSEDFAGIFEALSAEEVTIRASGRELIQHVLEEPFRVALLAVTDSLAPAEQLQRAASTISVPLADMVLAMRRDGNQTTPDASGHLPAVTEAMCNDRSVILASTARYQLRSRVATRRPMESHRVAS